MRYQEKFFEKRFSADNTKSAYLQACEFIAKNIIGKSSKVEAEKVAYQVQNVTEPGGLPTFKLELFALFDDREFKRLTCEACKQFHSSFYINQQFNCDKCNKIGYERQVQEKLKICTSHLKERLGDQMDK